MPLCPSCDQPTTDPAAPFCAYCGFALPAITEADWSADPEPIVDVGPSLADPEHAPIFAAEVDRVSEPSAPHVGDRDQPAQRHDGARAVPVALGALTSAVILAIALSYGGSDSQRSPAQRSSAAAAARSPQPVGSRIAALGSEIAFTGTRATGASRSSAAVSPPAAVAAVAVPTTRHRAGAYTFAYPSSWSVAKDNQPIGNYRETVLESADRAAKVTVDYSPGETTNPAAKAAQVESATSLTPGYQQTAFRATKVGARPAFEWVFKVAAPHPQRADLFVNTGRDGFALLSYGADFARARSAGRAIAASLAQPR